MIENFTDPKKNAAVYIATLNRYEHFKRCVESLSRCRLAEYTDLYIGLDYPPSEKYEEGYRAICDYLDSGITGFASVNIVKHEKNLGSEANMLYLNAWVSKDHETFILSEDDNEFAEDFLEYINLGLKKYKDDESVLFVCGYNYPIKTDDLEGDIYDNPVYMSAWGFGCWCDRYKAMLDGENAHWLTGIYKNGKYMSELKRIAPNQYCNFVKGMLGYTTPLINKGQVWKIDMVHGLYMFDKGQRAVFPTVSHVRNWGYDGSGVNCNEEAFDENAQITHRNFVGSRQGLESKSYVEFKTVSDADKNIIWDRLSKFFCIDEREMKRTNMAYLLSRILGIKTVKRILGK